MASLSLRVTGMTCSHCKRRVTDALSAVTGAAGAWVEWEGGTAEVEFDDSRASRDDFLRAVRDAGYDTPAEE